MPIPASDVTPAKFNGGNVIGSRNDDYSYQIDRYCNYSGQSGDRGATAAALGVRTTTYNNGYNFEWALRAEMHNYSTNDQTENVAAYAAGRRYSGAGATWGMATDLMDFQVNPQTPSVCCEDAMMAKGNDNYGNRVITGVYGKRIPVDRGGDLNTAFIRYGILEFTELGAHIEVGFHQDGNYTRGINLTGNYTSHVLDLSGANTGGNAIEMDAEQKIHLGHGMYIRYGGNGHIEFLWGSTVAAYIDMTQQVGQLT